RHEAPVDVSRGLRARSLSAAAARRWFHDAGPSGRAAGRCSRSPQGYGDRTGINRSTRGDGRRPCGLPRGDSRGCRSLRAGYPPPSFTSSRRTTAASGAG
ncbi:unnamed protein product, partial [Ectocarpus fasciculatus]